MHMIRQVLEKQLTQVEAARLLGRSDRKIRRLSQWVKQEGDQGLKHQGRGHPSNRRIPEKKKAKAFQLYEQRYSAFGRMLVAEQLAERDSITISDGTLRRWLRKRSVTNCSRRKRPHRAWRAPKAHVGEPIQLNGSHHDWFEGPSLRCVLYPYDQLVAFIDDASNQVSAQFYEYKGMIPARDGFQRDIQW